jgi:hypothetical protein
MKSREKLDKEVSITRDKKDPKSKTSNNAPKDSTIAEHHHSVEVVEDTTTRISFLIDYSLVARELRGKITHKLTDKQEEFSGRGETNIIQFLNRYLSKLEKSVEKVPVSEVRITPPGVMRNLGLDVIPVGSA